MSNSKRIPPGPGQESVWDYPRPPAVEPLGKPVRIMHGETLLCATGSALRLLETSHPPTVYVPAADVDLTKLVRNRYQTGCEWKGTAGYYDLGDIQNVAWFYDEPRPRFLALKDHLAFYPSKVRCWIGDEPVKSQEGDFYGGWITDHLVGPFKGGPGTWGW